MGARDEGGWPHLGRDVARKVPHPDRTAGHRDVLANAFACHVLAAAARGQRPTREERSLFTRLVPLLVLRAVDDAERLRRGRRRRDRAVRTAQARGRAADGGAVNERLKGRPEARPILLRRRRRLHFPLLLRLEPHARAGGVSGRGRLLDLPRRRLLGLLLDGARGVVDALVEGGGQLVDLQRDEPIPRELPQLLPAQRASALSARANCPAGGRGSVAAGGRVAGPGPHGWTLRGVPGSHGPSYLEGGGPPHHRPPGVGWRSHLVRSRGGASAWVARGSRAYDGPTDGRRAAVSAASRRVAI